MTEDDANDPFGQKAHDDNCCPLGHSGDYGHYCLDWDGLWICKDCAEFDCCTCFEDINIMRRHLKP